MRNALLAGTVVGCALCHVLWQGVTEPKLIRTDDGHLITAAKREGTWKHCEHCPSCKAGKCWDPMLSSLEEHRGGSADI